MKDTSLCINQEQVTNGFIKGQKKVRKKKKEKKEGSKRKITLVSQLILKYQ